MILNKKNFLGQGKLWPQDLNKSEKGPHRNYLLKSMLQFVQIHKQKGQDGPIYRSHEIMNNTW